MIPVSVECPLCRRPLPSGEPVAYMVSGYATMHPWEDWAETWAPYLRMIDVLEIAAVCGLSLEPRGPASPGWKRDSRGRST